MAKRAAKAASGPRRSDHAAARRGGIFGVGVAEVPPIQLEGYVQLRAFPLARPVPPRTRGRRRSRGRRQKNSLGYRYFEVSLDRRRELPTKQIELPIDGRHESKANQTPYLEDYISEIGLQCPSKPIESFNELQWASMKVFNGLQ